MNSDYLCIIPECFADTNLVQTLLRVKSVNHQKSCGHVTNEMQKRFYDEFAVGVIDLDKKQSQYSEDSVVIASSEEFSVCKHPNSHHYLIKIHNVLEKFIINCAKEQGLDCSALGIPMEKEELMKFTKKQEAKRNPLLTKFFKQLSGSKEMRLLKEVLEYLHTNKYSVDEEQLRQLFKTYGYEQEH